MNYLSNANLRAVLTILVARAGGEVHVTNDEIYEAMMPSSGLVEHLVVESVAGGIYVSVRDSYSSDSAAGRTAVKPPADPGNAAG